jgi:hypothetical protein
VEVTGEIAGGVVMKTGCPALEELTIARKHAKITNPKAESRGYPKTSLISKRAQAM